MFCAMQSSAFNAGHWGVQEGAKGAIKGDKRAHEAEYGPETCQMFWKQICKVVPEKENSDYVMRATAPIPVGNSLNARNRC